MKSRSHRTVFWQIILAAVLLAAALPAPAGAVGAGYALQFDGLNDFVTLANAGSIMGPNWTTTKTISLWVKPTGVSPVCYNGAVAWCDNIFGDRPRWWGIARGTINGLDRIWLWNWDGSLDAIAIPYTAGEWTHIAMVHDGGVIRGFKNGVEVGSITSGPTQQPPGTPVLQLGGVIISSSRNWTYEGLIDEVQIWNVARTASDISIDMNRALAGDEPGLAAYYRMSDGAGLTLTDDSVAGWNGTLYDGGGIVPPDGQPPLWVPSDAFPDTNNPPVAADDSAVTDEDLSVTIAVLGNDSDPDGHALSIVSAGPAAHGTVAIEGASINYTPGLDYNGLDSFTYLISDGNGGESSATVTVTILPVNDPPVALDDFATTQQGTSVSIPVLANDSDPDPDVLSVVAAGPAAHGDVSLGSGTVTYSPDPAFTGEDSFGYTIFDGSGGEASATVVVFVEAASPTPTSGPTATPTTEPTNTPTPGPTDTPTTAPTATATATASATPTSEPTNTPTSGPTETPTTAPTATATATPTTEPTALPTAEPTATPTTAPLATPTSAPPPNTLHIGDLDGQTSVASSTQWRAVVISLVHDANDNPVPGAAIRGVWSSGSSNQVSCTTNSLGSCILSRTGLRFSRDSSVTFTVSSVSMTGFTYFAAANHDPDGDSDGTAITILAPTTTPTSTVAPTATAGPTQTPTQAPTASRTSSDPTATPTSTPTGPAAPSLTEVGAFESPDQTCDVEVQGAYAYVANVTGGLLVLDVSVPEQPVFAGSFDTPRRAYGVDIVGSLAYVADGRCGLHILDIGNPAQPVSVGALDMPDYAWDVFVAGNHAYVADRQAGLRIIDVSDPTAPFEVGWLDTPDEALNVIVDRDYAFVAEYRSGVRVINVADPSAPVEVASYTASTKAYGLALLEDRAFICDGTNGFHIVSVLDPNTPTALGADLTATGSRDVAFWGNYAVVASDSAGVRMFDVSDPMNPYQVAGASTPSTARGIDVSGDYAYVAAISSGVRVFSISGVAL